MAVSLLMIKHFVVPSLKVDAPIEPPALVRPVADTQASASSVEWAVQVAGTDLILPARFPGDTYWRVVHVLDTTHGVFRAVLQASLQLLPGTGRPGLFDALLRLEPREAAPAGPALASAPADESSGPPLVQLTSAGAVVLLASSILEELADATECELQVEGCPKVIHVRLAPGTCRQARKLIGDGSSDTPVELRGELVASSLGQLLIAGARLFVPHLFRRRLHAKGATKRYPAGAIEHFAEAIMQRGRVLPQGGVEEATKRYPAGTVKRLAKDILMRRVPPRDGIEDPFARAWATTTSPGGMIALLESGAAIGLYELGEVSSWSDDYDDTTTRWLFRLKTPEGTYVRMDITRAGGAEMVRALLPTIAPYDSWVAALDRERETRAPIEVLLCDLARDGVPDRRWHARHRLRDVWRDTTDGFAMRDLLKLLGRTDLYDRAQDAICSLEIPPFHCDPFGMTSFKQEHLDFLRKIADAVRGAVPEPPPLPYEKQAAQS